MNGPSSSSASAKTLSGDFIQLLTADLGQDHIDLPACPEVVARVRRALDDPDSPIEHVVQIIGAEPSLAARIVSMANSAAFTYVGRTISDLHTAIIRLGAKAVRGAAMAFAVEQMRQAPALKAITRPLEILWGECAHIAAISSVLARRTAINPDQAFLAGLFHGMGRMYILVRAAAYPRVLEDAERLREIERRWHGQFAKALLVSWDVPLTIVEAVFNQDRLERARTEPDLTCILICAKALAAHAQDPVALVTRIHEVDAFRALKLDAAEAIELLIQAAEKIQALRQALS